MRPRERIYRAVSWRTDPAGGTSEILGAFYVPDRSNTQIAVIRSLRHRVFRGGASGTTYFRRFRTAAIAGGVKLVPDVPTDQIGPTAVVYGITGSHAGSLTGITTTIPTAAAIVGASGSPNLLTSAGVGTPSDVEIALAPILVMPGETIMFDGRNTSNGESHLFTVTWHEERRDEERRDEP